jgi:fermentation-respiration switch protein FrsA (DUF1100 family)
MSGFKPVIKRWFFILTAIAAVDAFIGCALQNKLIFPAEKLAPDHEFFAYKGGAEVKLKARDGVELSAMRFSNFKSEKVILYLHGNAGSLESWRYEYGELEYLGKDMIFLDYRGYGKSGGEVSEKGLYLDAQSLYDYAKSLGYADSNIIVYGRSIGTGVAVDLAQDKGISALVLESPYSSFKKLVYHEYWFMLPYFYLAYSLDNCAKMAKVKTKVMIFHGTADEVIPYKYGQALSDCFDGKKTFVSIPGGGHNDLGRFAGKRNALAEFLR